MRLVAACIAAAVVAMPRVAFAQTPQSGRACRQAPASTCVHHIGRSEASPYDDVHRGSLDGQVAASQCVPGRTAEAIPVLERKPRNGKVTLPLRGWRNRPPSTQSVRQAVLSGIDDCTMQP